MKRVAEKRDEEFLTPTQRWTGLITDGAMLVLLGFFAYHQLTNTGLFTTTFGPLEMFVLYGPILVSLAAPVVRALSGRRNPARPFDAATNLFLALGSLWLFIVFPFNFAHLTDVFPGAIRFVLAWITNDIGKAILILQILVAAITALLETFRYYAARQQEPVHGTLQHT